MRWVLALALLVFIAPSVYGRVDVTTYVPAGAITYNPLLKAEQRKYWPDHPAPALLSALVEQESCIHLNHPLCWNPKSSLKTAREEGAGLGQITRAYRKDGRVRFDALQEMVEENPTALKGWSWVNVYQRADLQLRAIVLKVLSDFKKLPNSITDSHRLAFADSAYNGGYGGLEKERTACGLSRGCDPKRWWGNVEGKCLKSLEPLYGNRSACDINREHVVMVMKTRPFKYIPFW